MKKPDSHKAGMVGGIVFAAFSSVCCTLPFIFAALGIGVGATSLLGGVEHFAGALIPYRPFFVLLTLIFLGLGYYTLYRKEKGCDGSVCSPEKIKRSKRIWWVIVGISLLLLLFPYLLEIFL
jgi:mercuric ion transport protein